MIKSLAKILATLALIITTMHLYASYPNCSGSGGVAWGNPSNSCKNMVYGDLNGKACSEYYEYNTYRKDSWQCKSTAGQNNTPCDRDSNRRCNPVSCPSEKADPCSIKPANLCADYYENDFGINFRCEANAKGTACQRSNTGCL